MSDAKLQSVELSAEDGNRYIDFSPPVMLSELGERLPGLIDDALGWPAGYRLCVQWPTPPAEMFEASSYDDPEVFKHQGIFSDAELDRPMTPDTNMVERVARAICRPIYEQIHSYQTAEVISKYIEINWPNHLDQARAAIAAMREPTEAMVEAGVARAADLIEADCSTRYVSSETWHAIIDTALVEGPKT